ncbi:MAG: hypothetical protein WAR01_10905, partial [Dokdonella sp.]|uniref:hypothetical protein n=1 Tax=Dokdonella sp. TaxID=2291710 RepID=UPI003BAF99C7
RSIAACIDQRTVIDGSVDQSNKRGNVTAASKHMHTSINGNSSADTPAPVSTTMRFASPTRFPAASKTSPQSSPSP